MSQRTTAVTGTCIVLAVVAALGWTRAAAAAAPATAPASLDALRVWLATPRAQRPAIDAQPFAKAPLTREQSVEARRLLWDDHAAEVRETRAKEWQDEAVTDGGHTLKFKQRTFGRKPPGGWNLYLSLHGGGNAPPELNDSQWENQIHLYQPPDSLYIAPRAPTNGWNLWHEPSVDVLLARLLADAFVLADVDPDHVYVMGYSAGGDGVYQLAPRMADRWAAAAMMAGHPNDASPLNLRNLGFTIHVGALDAAYDRNAVAARWGEQLDGLHRADPTGYPHEVKLHEGRGHWMNLEDRAALPWMAAFTRNPTPDKVVWRTSAAHDRSYWLAIPRDDLKDGSVVVASRKGQRIEIEKAEGVRTLTVLLNDTMLDLDRPVTIVAADKNLFQGVAPRTIATLSHTLAARGDPRLVFDAEVTVRPPAAPVTAKP